MRNMLVTLILSNLILFAASSASTAAPKLTNVSYANGAATIEIFIEIYGDAASDTLAQQWEAMVEKIWNDALAEHGCSCFSITVDVHMKYRDSSENPAPTPGWESWEVQTREDWEAADPDWTPYVELPATTVENSDRFEGESGTGQMADNEPWALVHEIAHLLGHDDQYSLPPGWEKGDPVPPTSADWAGNLMAGPKITAEQWETNLGQFFSAKNYEEIQQAVLDYLDEHEELAPKAVVEMEIDLDFHQNAWGPAGPSGGMNSDKATSVLKLCVEFFEGETAPDYGTGTLTWAPVSRVPGTWFARQETTNNPFPIEATGRVEYEHGFGTYFVTLVPRDMVNYVLTTGEVYASGSHLSHVFNHTQFENIWVSGTLNSFQFSPMVLAFGDTDFPLRIETPAPENVQSVGSGMLRVTHSVMLGQ